MIAGKVGGLSSAIACGEAEGILGHAMLML
jgi:hypothetical protein